MHLSRASGWLDGALGGLVAFAIVGVSNHAIRPAATYRTLELGGTVVAVGLVAASYGAVAMFLAVPIGRAVDRADPRFFFLTGTFSTGLGAAACAFAPGLAWLALGQVLVGSGWVMAAIGFQTMTANRRHSDRDRGFARLAVAASVGQLLGPYLAGVVLDGGLVGIFATRASLAAFLMAAAFAFGGTVIAWFVIPVDVELRSNRSSADGAANQSSIPTLLRRPGVPQALLVGIATLSTVDLSIIYLPVIGEARGIGPSAVGALLAVRAGAGLASRLALPALITRLRRRTLLVGAMLSAAVSLAGIATLGSVVGLGICLAVMGFGLGIATPLTMAWLTQTTPRAERGTVLAVRMSGNRFSQVVVPATFGGVAAVLGPGAIFLVLSAALLMSAAALRTAPLNSRAAAADP
ncbi:MFS transporter [Egicoccus halophilus]|uniref:MFS transporter n=1 Tax=Egicoccus halophilus TaxID=1670830 RepID=A0A8J3A6S8_9ACTN|nr:MFS transporter [Egicoccus halophilus]GGI02409.1 MFS transporter [Egicoccus halophilus]